MIIFTKS